MAAMLQPPFTVSSPAMTAPTEGPFAQSVSMGPVPEGVGATRALTIGEAFNATAAAYPDQDAVVYADRNYRLTWGQFKQRGGPDGHGPDGPGHPQGREGGRSGPPTCRTG